MRFSKYIFILTFLVLTACGGGSETSTSNTSNNNNDNTSNNQNPQDGSGTNGDGSGTNGDGSGTNGDGSGTNGDGSGTNGDGSGTNGDGSGTNGDGSGTNGNGADSQNLTSICPASQTLETLIDCIKEHIPEKDSNDFELPNQDTMTQWASVIRSVLAGSCENINLPSLIAERYLIQNFTDTDNNQSYCTLIEVIDNDQNGFVDKGWGTVIINQSPDRNLDIQIPHPIFDGGTMEEGIRIFKESGARVFMVSGTHRHTSTEISPCQDSYKETDVAHNILNLFHITAVEMKSFYESNNINDYVAIQFHKIADDTCGAETDVFATYGKDQAIPDPSSLKSLVNQLALDNPAWQIRSPRDNNPADCRKFGSSNIQGRLVNGSDPALLCSQSAPDFSQNFIHIEQKNCCNDPLLWINSINLSFPQL